MRLTKDKDAAIAPVRRQLAEYLPSLAGPVGGAFGDKGINGSTKIAAGVAGRDQVVSHLWLSTSVYL